MLSRLREKYVDPIIFEQPDLSVMEKLKDLQANNRVRHDREDPIYGLERAVNDPAIDLAAARARHARRTSRHPRRSIGRGGAGARRAARDHSRRRPLQAPRRGEFGIQSAFSSPATLS